MDDNQARLRRIGYRAWHRGTREADFMIGGFYDVYSSTWGEDELVWFERLLEEEDVDIMAWAFGAQTVSESYAGPMMEAFMKLDYITIPR